SGLRRYFIAFRIEYSGRAPPRIGIWNRLGGSWSSRIYMVEEERSRFRRYTVIGTHRKGTGQNGQSVRFSRRRGNAFKRSMISRSYWTGVKLRTIGRQ